MIKDGFDEAANDAEQVAIAMGHDAHPDQTAKASDIIEEMREDVIGGSTAPNPGMTGVKPFNRAKALLRAPVPRLAL